MVNTAKQPLQYLNMRYLIVLCLGFSSGLPIALTSTTIQAWFTVSNISLVTIGALTLVGLPYVWKFLWAPLMDRFIPPFWGRRRGWILLTQLGLCAVIFILGYMDPKTDALKMGLLTLLIAFLSASQDVAEDAYRTELLQPTERGLGSAYHIFAYRMATLVSGGLALILADHFGWQITYECIAILLALFILATYFAPTVPNPLPTSKSFSKAMLEPFKSLLQREEILWVLAFVFAYKLGDALAISLMSTFLLKGLGFTLTEVGIAYKTLSILGTILGAFFGGYWLTRKSLFSCLIFFGLAQAASTILFALLAIVGKNYAMMTFTLFVENFCSGMGTAAFLAFLMSLCERKYTASQFALFSAVASLGRTFAGPIASVMVLKMGWVNFYTWSFILSFPGVLLLLWKRNKVMQYAMAE